MPLVSIIVPTYNRLPILKETIDSVLSQHFTDLELIVVDDGSTDNTSEIVILRKKNTFVSRWNDERVF